MVELSWFPLNSAWNEIVGGLSQEPNDSVRWQGAMACARSRIDFMETAKLDRTIRKVFQNGPPAATGKPLRLALLGSSTLKHLIAAIRVGALRQGLWLEILEGEYGQYQQELMLPASAIARFKPDVVLLALDAHHVTSSGSAAEALDTMVNCWEGAKALCGATVIQQTILPVLPRVLGNNEHRESGSPAAIIEIVNAELRKLADEHSVHLLAVDSYAARHGIREWHDPVLWHRSKQEVHPRVSHLYGDLVGRVLGALRGRSSKCLVLDLDNTLWGGIIGDDGLEGIQIGQGSTLGEAFVAFQQYARQLARRGVILAVCSKNDEVNALSPFEKHPDMVLRRNDIACFVANWQDKAANLRHIAKVLNIGLDALVFADDNPFERNLVRQELPEIQVPELPEDPAFYIQTIADAGYFEALEITQEDRERGGQYRANAEREQARSSATDMEAYLAGLSMELDARPFDRIGLSRIVQLINKTNQFNLTTRRYTEAEVRSMMDDPSIAGFQFRLADRFGDNGMIAVQVGRLNAESEMEIDTWLMSCRVLGRQVEEACLNVLVDAARQLGASRLIGEYIPSGKNGMVREHYGRLGFTVETEAADGTTRWMLPLEGFEKKNIIMRVNLS